MEFMLWATRSIHVFAAVVWLGGLLYMGGVLYPVMQHEKTIASGQYVRMERRFAGFVWMSIWTVGITGAFLTIFTPRLVTGAFRSAWDFAFYLKLLLYVVMVSVAFRSTSIITKMESLLRSASEEELETRLGAQHRTLLRRRRINLSLGLIILLISTSLAAR